MENSAQALHNAVRRYCYDQYRHWCAKYASTPKDDSAGSYRYSAKQKDVFPRYNVLNAIRVAVESVDPDAVEDFTLTKSLLDSLGHSANDQFTVGPLDDIERNAQDDERNRYSEFVRSLCEESVWHYETLPYRRVLNESESETLWQTLSHNWEIELGGYWYPLVRKTKDDVFACDADAFHSGVPNHAFARLLRTFVASRVYELRQGGPNYQLDPEAVEPFYNGAEGYWTTADCQWVLYASHESSITLAGSVLERVKTIWPSWTQHEIKPLW